MKTVTIPQLWLAAAALTALTLACSPKPEPKTVEFYVANKDARVQRLSECQNDPGTLRDDPDCLNAKQAVMKAWSQPNLPSFDPNTGADQSTSPASDATK